MAESPLVLVTGASGFIASWVAFAALKQGYRVRGTVRSLKDNMKVGYLEQLCPDSKYKIELCETDLNKPDGWDAAVKGATFIFHVASPFPINEPRDKNELIKPAVEGTLHVLRAASRLEIPPKRVIITSSTASIAYGSPVESTVYTDEHWTVTKDPKHPILAYIESKTLAEKAAWDFVQSLPSEKSFELTTINPTAVLGPMISKSSCTSADIVRQIITGELQGLPDLTLDIVCIYDVVKAHMLAMTHPEAAGKRFMVHGAQLNIREVAAIIKEEFSPMGYRPTTTHIPAFVIWMASFFDAQTRTILGLLGVKRDLQPNNVKKILGMKLNTDGPAMVKAMTYGAIRAGLIPDRLSSSPVKSHFVMPELDLSDVPLA